MTLGDDITKSLARARKLRERMDAEKQAVKDATLPREAFVDVVFEGELDDDAEALGRKLRLRFKADTGVYQMWPRIQALTIDASKCRAWDRGLWLILTGERDGIAWAAEAVLPITDLNEITYRAREV